MVTAIICTTMATLPPRHALLWCNVPLQVDFYLPQLCIVVALGDFARPSSLVELLLELCESDLRLAHKTHWFLKSFCTGGGTVRPVCSAVLFYSCCLLFLSEGAGGGGSN